MQRVENTNGGLDSDEMRSRCSCNLLNNTFFTNWQLDRDGALELLNPI